MNANEGNQPPNNGDYPVPPQPGGQGHPQHQPGQPPQQYPQGHPQQYHQGQPVHQNPQMNNPQYNNQQPSNEQQNYNQPGGQPVYQAAPVQSVYVQAPGMGAGAYGGAGNNIGSGMGLAIFAMICCCFPLGIIWVIMASKVSSKVAKGDFIGARKLAGKVKMFSWLTIIFGAIGIIVFIALFIGLNVLAELERSGAFR